MALQLAPIKAAVWPFLKPVWTAVKPILSVGIPLWVVLLGWAWFQWGATVDQRQAIRSAVQEFVAGAELEAARATAEANDKLRLAAEARAAETRRRAEAAEAANAAFAARAAEADQLAQNLQDEVDELLSSPVASDCRLDGGLLDRLHHPR